MYVLARRFTIVTLVMAIFAIGFAAIVTQQDRGLNRYHTGTMTPCLHPATPGCTLSM